MAALHTLLAPLDCRSERGDACVLIVLFRRRGDGCWSVLLTQRATALSTHGGEVAFPGMLKPKSGEWRPLTGAGGKRDAGDDTDVDVALREAWEEIGLERQSVTVVACMTREFSKHGLMVTPVVAELVAAGADAGQPSDSPLHPFSSFTLNAGEVDSVFSAPLELFLQAERHSASDIEWRGLPFRLHSFDHVAGPHDVLLAPAGTTAFRVWGFTARLCIKVAQAVLGRDPAFALHPDTDPPRL